jgi:hypothetical protein
MGKGWKLRFHILFSEMIMLLKHASTIYTSYSSERLRFIPRSLIRTTFDLDAYAFSNRERVGPLSCADSGRRSSGGTYDRLVALSVPLVILASYAVSGSAVALLVVSGRRWRVKHDIH